MAIINGDEDDNFLAGDIDGIPEDDIIDGFGGDDELKGRGGDDILRGGVGADMLDGGGGFDIIDYSTSAESVAVVLGTGFVSGGDAAGDTFTSIEGVIGTNVFEDTLIGSSSANILDGLAGNDRLNGLEDDDVLYGRDGSDFLMGGAGADKLFGGGGFDWARYAESEAGVTINLATGTASGGNAEGDKLKNMENIEGSDDPDSLTGNSLDNFLRGLSGADILKGGDGDDILQGGGRDDYLEGGAGNDTLDGGGLGGSDANGGGNNILYGGAGFDTLTGGLGDDRVHGGKAADTLIGGEGIDYLEGGKGADRFVFNAPIETLADPDSRDLIADFSQTQGDLIDLSRMDADETQSGDQAFILIGDAAFAGVAGELRSRITVDLVTVIAGDVNGDAKADFQIELTGGHTLTAGDFIL